MAGDGGPETLKGSGTYVYPVKSLFLGIRTSQDGEKSNDSAASGEFDSLKLPSEVPSGSTMRLSKSKSKKSAPNYRHYPGEASNPYFPRSVTSGSEGSAIPAHFESVSAGGEVFGAPSTSEARAPALAELAVDLRPFNPSEYIQLPPLPASDYSGPAYSHSPSPSSSPDLSSTLDPPRVSSDSTSGSYNSCQSSASTESSGEGLVTFRYEATEDENGNHVVIGREGQLQRCEDEPIHSPGAVQGFGVLIAVAEDVEQGILVVRQVSENSTDILGLSPRFLFSLQCFSDTLPESQQDVLWDNIQFLNEPNPQDEEQEENPHVFLLSGWGAPGSASDDDADSSKGRRSWACWCAVHRPTVSPSGGESNLIILEFELERDLLNPLYPTVDHLSSTGSSISSPGSGNGSSTSGASSSTSGTTATSTSTHTGASSSGESTVVPDSRTPLGDLGTTPQLKSGLAGDDEWTPSAEDVLESTTSHARPVLALERLRRLTRTSATGPVTPDGIALRSVRRANRKTGSTANGGVGMMDVFAVMGQINEQLGAAGTLDVFLNVVVGVLKDLTQFHRVLVYQFDEAWNGQVVSELVDWSQTHDLYKGLHFPASDIPAQARELYCINKVRLLYDRSQPTARIIVRSKEDLDTPLNMTHCYMRAMSPIHIKYLGNMGVRASMSVSIMAFGSLWGLITCHSYGDRGMRVSFPVRQMLRLLSQSISRNIERLSYAQRLHTRKLINTMSSDHHPTGYIVSNADDLLGLFDADFGILVIGEGAKIMGANEHGQEILVVAEYLRLKQMNTIQASQAVVHDFPDLHLASGLEVIAGLLYVPLSSGGKDFIAFLRKGQPKDVHWAGKPFKENAEGAAKLEPRKSFKMWSEVVAGRCRQWSDEQLETAGVLALVYGKFIEVWRQKENALQTTKLTNLLLSNASHEVRTPLNHIINYLEMALHGSLDPETRDNLTRSHVASKSLLFTINDLLDLTRLESGNETSFNEPFDLHTAIQDATCIYMNEAERRDIEFELALDESPTMVVGDNKKIRTVVANLTANALKYTTQGRISIRCKVFGEPEGLRGLNQTAVEIIVADTGCGIQSSKLESIFREFEQVETTEPAQSDDTGVGLGLAVVARIVEQLGGQLRVDSKVGEGSCFSFLIPLALAISDSLRASPSSSQNSSLRSTSLRIRSRTNSHVATGGSEIDNLVDALATSHMAQPTLEGQSPVPMEPVEVVKPASGTFGVMGSQNPIRPVKIDQFDLDVPAKGNSPTPSIERLPKEREPIKLTMPSRLRPPMLRRQSTKNSSKVTPSLKQPEALRMRVLIVDDDEINRKILTRLLHTSGHSVVNTANGQEALDTVIGDREFDCVLMDIQMPILNGFEATEQIRQHETATPLPAPDTPDWKEPRLSQKLNGRIPIFAVSASLFEHQRNELINYGLDGWILKPIDLKRMRVIMRGILDAAQRESDAYTPGRWEAGGWLGEISEVQSPTLGRYPSIG